MNSKSWLKSKTIIFNLAVAVLTVLTAESETIRSLLSDGGYVVFAVSVALGNAWLRTVTDTAITPVRKRSHDKQ